MVIVSMWRCSELESCPACHPAFALRQLGVAPENDYDSVLGNKRVYKMDGWIDGCIGKEMANLHCGRNSSC